MTLGTDLWSSSKPFYDKQQLAQHGDSTERYAATSLNIVSNFPNYEKFWRYHVCPTTTRPTAITYREGVADIISVITQRNYTIFIYLVEALDHLNILQTGELGLRNRNCYITLMYAGNALQIFTDLQNAICGSPKPLKGMRCLTEQLEIKINLFPEWEKTRANQREILSTYRNYLTHQGWFYMVEKSATKQLLVLKPEEFAQQPAYTWTHAARDYEANPNKWIPIQDLCRRVVDDTIAFLNEAYGRICETLDPQLSNAKYQKLWGWMPDQSIPESDCAPQGTKTPNASKRKRRGHMVSINLSGKTSSGVDDLPGVSGIQDI